MFGSSIPWPNPQNSLDTIYWFFTGHHLVVGTGPEGIFSVIQELALVGVILSAIFLVAFIYLHLSLERLGSAAQERRHEQEHAIAAYMRAARADNPHRVRWQHIIDSVGSSNPNDWRSAIMDADVMLDAMLTERGFVGADVGEKLQSASRGQFASIEAVWEAHRTRNKIAHGGTAYTLTDREARIAIDGYGRAFEEFNYL